MKELSDKEKAQRYDEALERYRAKRDFESKEIHDYIEYIFPELKESEDEKIRKAIHIYLDWLDGGNKNYHPKGEYSIRDMIAWLEKQGKLDNNDTNILNRFSFYSYKDEPNILYLSGLYVNDEYRNKGIGTKILKVANEVAASMKCNSIRLKTEKGSHAEKLYRENGYTTILGEEENQIWLEKQCGKDKLIKDGNETMWEKGIGVFGGEFYPATKEQCDKLFKAITDAGYKWDTEKKELKKIEQKFDTDFSDLRTWKYIVDSVWTQKEGIGQYLDSPSTEEVAKKLQKRFGNIEQKSAWSEEDIEMIGWLIRCCEKEHKELCNDKYGHQDIVSDLKRDCRKKWDWLESLKERITWKPSEEQMKVLDEVIRNPYLSTTEYNGLIGLMEQLKNL